MISPEEATKIVLSHPFHFVEEKINVHHSLGRTLRVDILADTDLPPFNRIMMDGVAIRFEDWEKGIRSYKVAATQRAGSPVIALNEAGKCIEVMTGGVCPRLADVIIPYEELEMNGEECTLLCENVRQGQNIHVLASDKKQGDVLISAGSKISAAEIGIAVSVGMTSLKVASLPRIHIFSTGDELVDTDIIPEAHQIRRSNVFALQQILKSRGVEATQSHLPDDYEMMRSNIQEQLQLCDAVLLTGAVSKGKFDFVPKVMVDLGVEKLFHGISQRPGKPMWFGCKKEKVVFALPGNPVSTFMCAHKYFIPWLRKSLSIQESPQPFAKLISSFDNKTTLTYFLQVKISFSSFGEILAEPIVGRGSGDYANLSGADGFLEIPAGPATNKKGTAFPLFLYRDML